MARAEADSIPMSEEQQRRTVPMLAATNMLRPPPARIGKIGRDFTLPRSVPVKNLVGAIVGAVGSLFLTAVTGSLQIMLFGLFLGGGAGVLAVTWSPMKGESLLKWLSLTGNTARQDRVVINGRKVRAYIGVAPLGWSAKGRTEVLNGAVEVMPGAYDDRGVLIPRRERIAQQERPRFPDA